MGVKHDAVISGVRAAQASIATILDSQAYVVSLFREGEVLRCTYA